MPEKELVDTQEVSVRIKPEDMPGGPLRHARCVRRGEYVQDMRESYLKGEAHCQLCLEVNTLQWKKFFCIARYAEKS
jgi:formylmethanofuran dehydrogenase subunit E